MTEPDSTRQNEFAERMRRCTEERDEVLRAVNGSYAEALAAGAPGVGLYPGYVAERGAVIDKFGAVANAIAGEYAREPSSTGERLPSGSLPVSAYPPPATERPAAASHPSFQGSTELPRPPKSKLARRGPLILGIAATVVGVLALINWYVYASQGSVSHSSKSGSSNSSPVTSTKRTVTYEVVGGAKSATITYQAPTGTAQASIKVPLVNKSGGMVTFEMDRGDFVYISAQNKGTSGNIICRISVDGKVISTVTSSGAYAIASCDGSVP